MCQDHLDLSGDQIPDIWLTTPTWMHRRTTSSRMLCLLNIVFNECCFVYIPFLTNYTFFIDFFMYRCVQKWKKACIRFLTKCCLRNQIICLLLPTEREIFLSCTCDWMFEKMKWNKLSIDFLNLLVSFYLLLLFVLKG